MMIKKKWSFLFKKLDVLLLGDMIYFNVLGQHFLVLGSVRRTTDLFEKRSLKYSDRMRMPMVMELYVFDFFFFFISSKKK